MAAGGGSMTDSIGIYRWAGVLALGIFAGAISVSTAAPGVVDAAQVAGKRTGIGIPSSKALQADVAQRFEDAPFGVDPVVTGPISAAFKEARKAAGCDSAVWPDVPDACYPD